VRCFNGHKKEEKTLKKRGQEEKTEEEEKTRREKTEKEKTRREDKKRRLKKKRRQEKSVLLFLVLGEPQELADCFAPKIKSSIRNPVRWDSCYELSYFVQASSVIYRICQHSD
jgi:hypothetical protein